MKTKELIKELANYYETLDTIALTKLSVIMFMLIELVVITLKGVKNEINKERN